jgi:ferric iron reductase protein FhuF
MANLLTRARNHGINAFDGPNDWIPATDLVSGERLDDLFALPERLWAAPAHAAVVLAWKAYTYRLIQPLAKAWTSARQVPVLSADNVRFRVQKSAPYVVVELRCQDPVTFSDEQLQLAFLRDTLIDGHLKPLMERTKETRRISERVLWGQAATAIAYSFADHSPSAATDCNRFTDLLPLTGLAGIGEDDAVWQSTCCLAFASPGLTACRTCVTVARPRHHKGSPSTRLALRARAS